MIGGRSKPTESLAGLPPGEGPTETAKPFHRRKRAFLRLKKLLLAFGRMLGLLIFGLFGFAVMVTIIHRYHFQPECLDDGVLYGRLTITAPLDPYYLSHVAELARYAGFSSVQFGPFLWVSKRPVRATPADFWTEDSLLWETPREKWHHQASFIPGDFNYLVRLGPSRVVFGYRDFFEEAPALARRLELLGQWIDTDPPGYWSNENHFAGICFAMLAYLRPTWAQMPWELMPRLIWQDQLQRIGAVLNGLPAR